VLGHKDERSAENNSASLQRPQRNHIMHAA
jgi:hypothetical protein